MQNSENIQTYVPKYYRITIFKFETTEVLNKYNVYQKQYIENVSVFSASNQRKKVKEMYFLKCCIFHLQAVKVAQQLFISKTACYKGVKSIFSDVVTLQFFIKTIH